MCVYVCIIIWKQNRNQFCFRFDFFFVQEDDKKKTGIDILHNTCAGRRYIREDPIGWQTLANTRSYTHLTMYRVSRVYTYCSSVLVFNIIYYTY